MRPQSLRLRWCCDAHFAEDKKIRPGCRRAHHDAPAAIEGEGQILGRKRWFLAEIPTAPARLVHDSARHRRFRQRAGIDDFKAGAELAREHRDRRAPRGEIRHHRDRHLLRIGRDALRSDAVVAGEDDDRRTIGARLFGVLQAREINSERLQPAERAGRLGELALARRRRLAMDRRDGRTWLGDPIGKHALSLT